MKKFLCTSLIILLIFGGISAVFAADKINSADAALNTATDSSIKADTTSAAIASAASEATPPAVETTESAVTIVPDMTFTGTPIKLSLEDAYKKCLQTVQVHE